MQTLPFGGRDITRYLSRQLGLKPSGKRGYRVHKAINPLKEQFCYCGIPSGHGSLMPAVVDLPDGKTLKLDVHGANIPGSLNNFVVAS